MAEQAQPEEIEEGEKVSPEGESKRNPEFMLWDELLETIPLSKSVLQRLMRRGTFPRPLQLSSCRVAFVRSEVEAWKEARKRERHPEQQAA